MPAPRYAKRRDKSESAIVEALRGLGVTVLLTDQPYDALLGYKGETYLAEFKTPGTHYGKKLNDNQAKFAEVWLGSPPLIFRTLDDVSNWFQGLDSAKKNNAGKGASTPNPTNTSTVNEGGQHA